MAELAALADGSLAPGRRAALEARVAASSELADRLGEQQRAVALARERRERGRGTGGAAGAHRSATTCAPRAGASSSRPDRRPCDRCAGGGHRGGRDSDRVPRASASTPPSQRPTWRPAPEAKRRSARQSSGWRIELDATGLPRLAGGRFYEAWLRNSAGVLVPIGTFNEGRNVTLWAGVSPKLFSTLTVTREQADGDQTSSGEKVLVGRVNTGG